MEHRIQQICQRRLRLSSELENTATSYNNNISNRQMYAMNTANSGISTLSIAAIRNLQDENGNNYAVIIKNQGGGDVNNTNFDASYGLYTFQGGNRQDIASFESLGLQAGASQAETVDAALRAGVIMIAKQANEFTQTVTHVLDGGPNTNDYLYELVDWRTVPSLADELYKGDDVDAENKYDKTIAEINAQDKKLQLEQTSIEVEYKAITSEKESVKKVLDTNAQTSFKYFS